jgi:hypothetical protein
MADAPPTNEKGSPEYISEMEKSHVGVLADGRRIEELPSHVEDLAQVEVQVIELPPEEEKRIMRKLDWVLVPQLTILYLLAFLDRSNST